MLILILSFVSDLFALYRVVFLFVGLARQAGNAQGMIVACEGYSFRMPDNSIIHIKSINIQSDSQGYVSDWEVKNYI